MSASSYARATLFVASLLGSGITLGVWLGTQTTELIRAPYTSTSVFHRVIAQVEHAWVDEIDEQTLLEGAIQGMMSKLDRHSEWLSADLTQRLNEQNHGTFTGIGVDLRLLAGKLIVFHVLPGGPAAQAGIAHRDEILEVDGQLCDPTDPYVCSHALTGAVGSVVHVRIQRADTAEIAEFSLTRAVVHESSVSAQRLSPTVGYIHLSMFREGSTEELRAALDSLGGDALEGLLLDLRDNPGGLLTEAIGVADAFLDDGVIVSVRGRLPPEAQVYEATPGAWRGKLILLVNRGSASASELVAATLQDTKRATLVGSRTYGKGTVQKLFPYKDGSTLKLTVARYYTASGEPVTDQRGRRPDVYVHWPGDDNPRWLLRHELENLGFIDESKREELLDLLEQIPQVRVRKTATEIDFDAPIAERLASDPQFARAAELLGVTHSP